MCDSPDLDIYSFTPLEHNTRTFIRSSPLLLPRVSFPNFQNDADRPEIAGPMFGVTPEEEPYWALRQGTLPYPAQTTKKARGCIT